MFCFVCAFCLRVLFARFVCVFALQTSKQANKQTGKQANRQTGKQANKQTGKQNRQTGKQANITDGGRREFFCVP
jgi:hypothetical protein